MSRRAERSRAQTVCWMELSVRSKSANVGGKSLKLKFEVVNTDFQAESIGTVHVLLWRH